MPLILPSPARRVSLAALLCANAGIAALTAVSLVASPVQAQTAAASSSSSASAASSSAATSSAAASSPAAPQTAPPPAAAPAPDGTDPTITVTATKPIISHKIDRDVYDVKQDPQASTGTASDVLNNVPAVTVDPQGNVALRGNSGVQVYVNGKKSASMQGDSRAFTLQSLSADDIDTIEVMPNPSAAYGSDSSAGIINIVMKRGRAIKPVTSINAVIGDEGRAMLGLRTGHVFGKLTLSGGVNLGHGSGGGGGGRGGGGAAGPKSKSYSEQTRLDPATGAVVSDDQTHSVAKSDNKSASANMSAAYTINDNDELDGSFDYRRTDGTTRTDSDIASFDGGHNLTGDRDELINSARKAESMNYNVTYDHRGDVGSSEDFKMQLQHSSNLSDSLSQTQSIYSAPVPVQADTYSAQSGKTKDYVDDFSGDWTHALKDTDAESDQIQTGWDIQHTASDQFRYRSLMLTQPVTPPQSPNPANVSQFNEDEVLSAGYFIWQQRLGKFTYQAGLRVEDQHQTLNTSNPVLMTPATTLTVDNVNYSPSLYLLYAMTDQDQLKWIYTQKIQRPSASQLNPLIVFSDDGLSASSGNPDLKPQKTDKYEFDYNRDVSTLNLSAKLYYNSTTGSIDSISEYLTSQPNVLLTTYENSGTLQDSGLDLFARASPNKQMTFMLSGSFQYRNWDTTDPVTRLPLHTKGPSSNAFMMFNYKPDLINAFNFRLSFRGRNANIQGYSTAQTSLGLSYVRQIIPQKLILTFNAQNLILGPVSRNYSKNSIERTFNETFNPGASFMVSLRYTFGAVRNYNGDWGGWHGGQGGAGGGHGGGGGYGGGGGGGGSFGG